MNGHTSERKQRTCENASKSSVGEVDIVSNPVHGHTAYLAETYTQATGEI